MSSSDEMRKDGTTIYNALIRTHHVTSRKKVSKLKEAHHEAHYVLIRSGGSPGLMYVESDEKGVEEWVDAVKVYIHLYLVTITECHCADNWPTRI